LNLITVQSYILTRLFIVYTTEKFFAVESWPLKRFNFKKSQFKIRRKALETANITVFDPVMSKTPDVPLQEQLLKNQKRQSVKHLFIYDL